MYLRSLISCVNQREIILVGPQFIRWALKKESKLGDKESQRDDLPLLALKASEFYTCTEMNFANNHVSLREGPEPQMCC